MQITQSLTQYSSCKRATPNASPQSTQWTAPLDTAILGQGAASEEQDLNRLQRWAISSGRWAGKQFRDNSHLSVVGFPGLGTALEKASEAGVPGAKAARNIQVSLQKGGAEFAASTVEELSEAAARPVETTKGLVTLASAVNSKNLITGEVQVRGQALLRGVSAEEIRSEHNAVLNSVKDSVVSDFQENREEFGLPGAALKSGLDIFGIPKAGVATAGKVGRMSRTAAKASDVSRPAWLKIHRETPTEMASRNVKIKPETLSRVETLMSQTRKGDGQVFHATNSDALTGLSKTGALLSARDLTKQKIARTSGEGTTQHSRGPNRGFVSLGEGPEGLGSALAYHDNLVEPPYSYAKLDRGALESELGRMKRVSESQRELSSFPGASEGASARVRDIEAELGRRGDTTAPRDVFPMILGFKKDGLDLRRSSDIPGEVRSQRAVNLRESLASVMAPKSRMADVSEFLEKTLGPNHGVEILPSEALHQVKHLDTDLHRTFSSQTGGVGVASQIYLDSAHKALTQH